MESTSGCMGGDRSGFAQTLDSLKRQGCNLLLVGSRTSKGHELVCRRLSALSSQEPRYRLLVTADSTTHRHGLTRPTETTTIEYATAESNPDGTALGNLGLEVIDAIDEFEAAADGLEPSELRVCVDSLVSLLQECETEAVFRLLHVVMSRTERARGMGHYHLPVSRDHDAVSLFEPMFDAVVELRTDDGVHEQRWHLRDREAPTDWIRLE
ncbi:hypothetical protein EA462_10070 [Natrarchaeobius halalkaliphilus]|uniref:KaiC-like domain-containing protein n=1 Tax=Natrarchaeobius halalkaliphilus TaxID=1679091 RepID=A0A3N6LMH8_9EURY|nr:hypothetical protein [Natrarchaeobius halalkaliphilus]RQG90313.1 hypothetical protein EA462_10070 [Natrarchaeobius halalkaliphilus]